MAQLSMIETNDTLVYLSPVQQFRFATFMHVDTEVMHCAISVKVFHTHYTCTVSPYKLPGVHLTGSAQYLHI